MPRAHAAIPLLSVAAPASRVGLSEVLAALSYALDLTEGQVPGHTLRSCIVGMRVATELGLDADARSALFYALLLKDAGCSSNAARMAALFGSDDAVVKRRMKLVDWHDRSGLAIATARLVALGAGPLDKARHFLGIARTADMTRDLMRVRCERGADIAARLGFPPATVEAIRSLDEHWNGAGYPGGLAGEAIPLLARICNLAQVTEVFFVERGAAGAIAEVVRRRGRWFDPALVDVVAGLERDRAWWAALRGADPAAAVSALEPAERVRSVDEAGLDAIALAFADIIDAKSPYTSRHSVRVAAIAGCVGEVLELDGESRRLLRRAALLHDIGKLGVSNRILDKPGRLDAAEREAVEQHPQHTWDILSRVDAFAEFAFAAAVHHEKLDGSGYPWRLRGVHLDPIARVLAVADVYEALTADRPYRAGMAPDDALAIVARCEGTQLCATSVAALREGVRAGTVPAR